MLRTIVTPFRICLTKTYRSSASKKELSTSIIGLNETSFSKIPTSLKGVYDPRLEKDSCGVGIVAHLKRQPSRQIVIDANQMLTRMSHRGGCGCEVNTGDGAGVFNNPKNLTLCNI